MNRILLRWGVMLAMLWTCAAAQAQYSCSLTISSLSTVGAIDPFSASATDTVGTVSVSCTRTAGKTNRYAASMTVGVDNGANWDGSTRRLRVGATSNYIPYSLYQSGCATAWDLTTGAIAIANANTKNPDTVTSPNPLTANFCFRIPGSQTTAAPGTYTDTVGIQVKGTVADANFVWAAAAPFTLSTSVNATCSFTTPASDMVINYPAFTGSAVPASPSNFGVRCTNTTAYLLALDTYGGTLLGVNYTLALSSGLGTGSGLEQNLQVTGSAAAGQAGVCAVGPCSDVANHTITITY